MNLKKVCEIIMRKCTNVHLAEITENGTIKVISNPLKRHWYGISNYYHEAEYILKELWKEDFKCIEVDGNRLNIIDISLYNLFAYKIELKVIYGGERIEHINQV